MSAVLQLFREKLPHKPYCTNDFTYGVRILPKDIAILARFIQQNQPHAQHWLA
ncbi:plasmid replication protein, partial [Escherichia coli]|nr:plasmid replication protein [Escherichia coli]